MIDISTHIKDKFQGEFSMAFGVSRTFVSGEEHYIISPESDDDTLFEVDVHLHNNVRVTVVAKPQRHAGAMIDDIKNASKEKVVIFKEYAQALVNKGADLRFTANGLPINIDSFESFPADAKSFELRASRTAIQLGENIEAYVDLLYEWSSLIVSMLLSFLHITDTSLVVDGYEEGDSYVARTKKYERNPINRRLCLALKGYRCSICGFDFESKYGNLGKDFIHVHHVTPVSLMGPGYVVDPARDLIPVCPNCHAMLHRTYPPLAPQELLEAILDSSDIE